jgi:PEP-CTERM motif
MMNSRAFALTVIIAGFLAVRVEAVTVETNGSNSRNDDLDRGLLPQGSVSNDSTRRGDVQTWSQDNNCNLDSAVAMQIQNWAANHNFDLSSLNRADVQTWLQTHPLFQFDGHRPSEGEDSRHGHDHHGHSGDDDSGDCDLGAHNGHHHEGDQGDNNNDQGDDQDGFHNPQPVPEPGTIASLASGALLLSGYLLRRRK